MASRITLSFLFLVAFRYNGVLSKELRQKQDAIPSRTLEQYWVSSPHSFAIVLEPTPTELTDTQQAYFHNVTERVLRNSFAIQYRNNFQQVYPIEWKPAKINENTVSSIQQTVFLVDEVWVSFETPHFAPESSALKDSVETVLRDKLETELRKDTSHGFASINVFVNDVIVSPSSLPTFTSSRPTSTPTSAGLLTVNPTKKISSNPSKRITLNPRTRLQTSNPSTTPPTLNPSTRLHTSNPSTTPPTSNPSTTPPTSNPSTTLPTSNPTKITSTTVTAPTPSEMQNNTPNNSISYVQKGQGLPTTSKPTNSILPLVAGLAVGALLIAVAAFCFVKRRRRRIHAKQEHDKHHQVVDDLTCSPSVTKGKLGILNVQLNLSESSDILDEEELTCAPSVTDGRIVSRGAENLGELSDLDTEMRTIPRGICISRQYSSGGLSIDELSQHTKSSLSLALSKGSMTGSLSSASMHSTRTEESFEVKHILGMSLQKGMLSSDEESHGSILKNTAGRKGRHYGIRGDSALSPTNFNASSLSFSEVLGKEGKRDILDREDTIHEHKPSHV